MWRLSLVGIGVLLLLLAACQQTAGDTVPRITAAGSPIVPTDQAAPGSPTPQEQSAPQATPSAETPADSANLPVQLAAPTSTPLFPTQQLDKEGLVAMRHLRTIGFGSLRTVATSPDGRLLAIGTSAGIAWFDLPAYAHRRFDPIEGGASTILFLADGQRILIGGRRTELRQVADGALVLAFDGKNPVLSPDGQFLATKDWQPGLSCTSFIWTIQGQKHATLAGCHGTFSPDGQHLLGYQVGENNTCEFSVWDIQGTKRATIPACNARFSADSQILLTSEAPVGKDGSYVRRGETPQLWDLDGRLIATLSGRAPVFHPDGRMVATLSSDAIEFWDSRTGTLLKSAAISPQLIGVADGAFTSDGARFVIAAPNLIQVWSISDMQVLERRTPSWQPSIVPEYDRVELNDEGTVVTFRLYFDSECPCPPAIHEHVSDGSVADDPDALEPDLGRFLNSLAPQLRYVEHIAFSPDGQLLAVQANPTRDIDAINLPAGLSAQQYAAFAAGADLWEITNTDYLGHVVAGDASHPHSISFSSDSQVLTLETIITYPNDPRIETTGWPLPLQAAPARLWTATARRERNPAIWSSNATTRVLAWVDRSGALLVQDQAGSQQTISLVQEATALAFSPDGSVIAAGDAQGTLYLLRVADQAVLATFQASGGIDRLGFSPDGSLVAGQHASGKVQIWSVSGAAPIAEVACAAKDAFIITADNQQVICGGLAGVSIYQISDGQVLHTIPVAASAIAIGPRQRLLALVHNGQVQLWGIP